MLTNPTLEQLRVLKLDGMARALEEQRSQPVCQLVGQRGEGRLPARIAAGVQPSPAWPQRQHWPSWRNNAPSRCART